MVWTRVIFNIALTGDTFWHLRYFVCSLIEQSDAQFRSVTNGCTSEAISQIGQFARRHRDRVVEVLDVSPSPATALSLNLNTAWHGIALHAEIEGFSATVIRPSPQTRRGWRVIAEADRLADLVAGLALGTLWQVATRSVGRVSWRAFAFGFSSASVAPWPSTDLLPNAPGQGVTGAHNVPV